MEVKLKVLSGKNAGSELKLAGPVFRIGRDEQCHLRPRSDAISRRHCEIVIAESAVTVRDLGSRNGTYVNNQRISDTVKLAVGDQLRVGPLSFEVLVSHTLGVGKKPKVSTISEAAARAAQSAKPQNKTDDIDLTEWLSDDEADDDGPLFSGGATTQFYVPEPRAEPATDNANPTDADPTDEPRNPTPPKAVDSREVAADLLNKYFRRR